LFRADKEFWESKYVIEHGYNVIPVNPTLTEVLGRKSYPSIADIRERIDLLMYLESHKTYLQL
jgi:predicted CoA-binding protein